MIYITGDTHGLNDISKLFPGTFPVGKKLTREDYVIITGDFGGIWTGGERDGNVLDFYREKRYMVLFVDGNHENFHDLNKYPIEMWNGSKVHRIDENIIHLMRGQIYEIEGKTIFTFGGGVSIDKAYRIPYVSWWPDEWPSNEEIKAAFDNLNKYNNKVDYVITHAAPETIVRNEINKIQPLIKIDCQTEKFLDVLFKTISFKMWFCGHYHIDEIFQNQKIMVLYNDIIKLSKGYPSASRKQI